ncbi:MAG TPA: Gfo/Idh/MocA family oxidoreductase [Armatimonadota bacterium]|nr:Gfo/Idh/MocA family oxidoreductase [Armatimonadota bacterium]
MTERQMNVAIVGCGNIAGGYAETLRPHPQIKLLGATDVIPGRAAEFTAKYGGRAYASLDDLLADPAVDVVVNLTIHTEHPAVITRCLEAGKHVHSEKPLAMTYEEARRVVELAHQKGLRLSCSPITFMGEAQQTAWKVIRDGKLGPVRVSFAEVNWGRIEAWHPAPGPFYEVGALFDVGVYPLTLLTTIFGPARRATAFGKVLFPDRVTREGVPFHIETPDLVIAAIGFENGMVVRLTTDFYVGHHTKQTGIEFHGDKGSVYLSSWQSFDAAVEFAEFGKSYEPVPYVKTPYEGTEWARALVEMADAIAENRPQRATGEQAAHVVEILCAIQQAYRDERPVGIVSNFTPPAPMEWA